MITLFINLLLLNPFVTTPEATTLTIRFENIRFHEGHILVGVYKAEDSWSRRTPEREFIISKQDIVDGSLTVTLNDFEPGFYGLAFLDDENGNEIVDMGMVFPKEGFGFSNYYHRSISFPKFKDFTFNFPENRDINVKFRYLKF
ncbi:MAG: DUF2141 domain-containing protein [Cytophagales bacterium]|nr:DUF2141 domain-containing protein [Cytophagales bacterium]